MTPQSSEEVPAARLVRQAEERLSAAEVPVQEEVRRGRRFIRLYVALLCVALVSFAVLAVLARDTAVLLRIDVPVTLAIQSVHLPLSRWVLTHTSDLGFFPLNVVAYAVVVVAFVAVGLRLEALLALVPSVLAGLIGSGIKLVIGRTRPTSQYVHVVGHLKDFSFPSGHVIQYTTLFGFAFYVVLVAWRGGAIRAMILAILALQVVLVGPSRIYLGQHWPSDVLGAYLLAGVWLAGTIELHLILKKRLGHRWPPRPTRSATDWHSKGG